MHACLYEIWVAFVASRQVANGNYSDGSHRCRIDSGAFDLAAGVAGASIVAAFEASKMAYVALVAFR